MSAHSASTVSQRGDRPTFNYRNAGNVVEALRPSSVFPASAANAAGNNSGAGGVSLAAFTPVLNFVGSDEGTNHWANATASPKVATLLKAEIISEVTSVTVVLALTNR